MFFFEKIWLGGAAPQTARFLAGGAKPPQTLPLSGRPQHLIEAARRGRLNQTLFFLAPLTTRAPPTTVGPDDRLGVRPAERPSGRPPSRSAGRLAERPLKPLISGTPRSEVHVPVVVTAQHTPCTRRGGRPKWFCEQIFLFGKSTQNVSWPMQLLASMFNGHGPERSKSDVDLNSK